MDQDTTVTASSKDTIAMSGAIGMSSTAAEIFLLQFADWANPKSAGWGVLDVALMARLLTLHNLQFNYMQRTMYIAQRQGSMLLRAVWESLKGGPYSGRKSGPMPPASAKFVAFVGHDTNIANLAALLDTDWPASEQLPDKTAPAGALLFELREYNRQRYVTAWYVAQTVDDMKTRRVLTDAEPPHLAALPLACALEPGGNVCRMESPADRATSSASFSHLVRAALDRDCLK
jgi:4-phytase/acid phosphatase